MELRCPHRKFGELTTPTRDVGEIEVSCPSRWCGKRPNVTVLHVFSTRTGELLSTRQFRGIPERGK
jgi:hypothetical protein